MSEWEQNRVRERCARNGDVTIYWDEYGAISHIEIYNGPIVEIDNDLIALIAKTVADTEVIKKKGIPPWVKDSSIIQNRLSSNESRLLRLMCKIVIAGCRLDDVHNDLVMEAYRMLDDMED